MGRGNRKVLREMAQPVPSGQDLFPLIPTRMLALSPLSGGAKEAFFTDFYREGVITAKPSITPKGPPLLDEDGEEDWESALIADMSLGQIGTDSAGNSFQLLLAEGQVDRILIRCLETGEMFWKSARLEPTVFAESVSYKMLNDRDLKKMKGSAEEAVWQMKEEGLFDMQVQDRGAIHTLIGNWYLKETPGTLGRVERDSAQRFHNTQAPRKIVETLAKNVETFPAIEAFKEKLLNNTLSPSSDKIEGVKNRVRKALLRSDDVDSVIKELYRLAHLKECSSQKKRMISLAKDLSYYSYRKPPEITDQLFVQEVAPYWRRVNSF